MKTILYSDIPETTYIQKDGISCPKLRNEMIDFLSNHERHQPLSSFSDQANYSNNVKIYNLNISRELRDKAFSFLQFDEVFEESINIIHEFEEWYTGEWLIETEGKSDGYLVLLSSNTNPETDWDDWTNEDLTNQVQVVLDFDRTCERAVDAFLDVVKTHKVVTKTVQRPIEITVMEKL